MSAVKKASAPAPTAVPSLIGRCVFIKRGPYQGHTAKVQKQLDSATYQVTLLSAATVSQITIRRDDVMMGKRGHGQRRVRG
ncbi:DUF3912 family protein [Bowmanella dokdonensis]|uniref:DUF3912 family protein n=1 Tax=Bowmanella dokdonensis TaxID=751969 RepID=A0A939IPX5_9ALTE|nr:DUF3912 family protein [Bowmanella dokdonensis]MBN7824444.1 DUF3912 family protein [Bowmanella dokdonensis]